LKSINAKSLSSLIADEYFKMNSSMSRGILNSLSSVKPKNSLEREVLALIMENQGLSKKNLTPLCQDTGVLTVFLDIGEDFSIKGNLKKEISIKLNEITKKKGLRFSVVDREKKYSNNPVIHIIQTNTKKPRIVLLAKGGGSENLSKMKMLSPSSSNEEIANFAVKCVEDAQSRGCPPYILSIGIGESAEESALLSKMALTGMFSHNKKSYEKEISSMAMKGANALKIGIQGLNFGETVADCRVLIRERHIASLPISVMFNCFQERVREIIL
jgi:fumarate hydratase subunit alpha